MVSLPISSDHNNESDIVIDNIPWVTFEQVRREMQERGYFEERRILRTPKGNPPTAPRREGNRSRSLPEGAAYQSLQVMTNGSPGPQLIFSERAARLRRANITEGPPARTRSDEAADPIVLESQDVFSFERRDDDNDANVDYLPYWETGEESTEDCPVKPLAVTNLSFVPDGPPFNEDEISAELPKYFYFFLAAMNFQTLRSVAKDFLLKQSFPKVILLARVFLTFMAGCRRGSDELELLVSEENHVTFRWFKQNLAYSVIEREMPTVQYLNDAAHARSAREAPKAHSSMSSPPGRVLAQLSDNINSTKKGGESDGNNSGEGSGNEKEADMGSRFLRNMLPRRLFQTARDKELEARRAEKRVEIANVSGEAPPPAGKKGRAKNSAKNSSPTVATVAGKKGTENTTNGPTDETVAGREECEGGKGMNPSEFARLMVLLKDDEACRYGFLNSGQVMRRGQLDRGEKSADFWAAIVEPAYNDKQNAVKMDFSGVMSGVHPFKPPRFRKTGEQLHTVFKSFRPKFMQHCHRYKASGQNSRDFKEFVENAGVNTNTALGKRIVIGGWVAGLDLLQPDHEFLHSIERTIGTCKSGKTGYDAPMSEVDGATNNNDSLFIRGTRKTKKDYMSGVLQQKLAKALDAITIYIVCAEKSAKFQDMRIAKSGDRRSEASPVTRRKTVARRAGTHPRDGSRNGGTPSQDGIPQDIDSLLDIQSALLDKISSARKKRRKCEDDDNWMAGKWDSYIRNATKRLDGIEEEMSL